MGLVQYCFLFLLVFVAAFNEPGGAYGKRLGGVVSRGRDILASAPGTAPETLLTSGGLCESTIKKLGYKCQEYTV